MTLSLTDCHTPFDFDIKEQSQRLVTFETFDQGDQKTWPDPKRPTYLHTYSPTYLPDHSLSHGLLLLTYKEQSQRLVTFETFDQSDEKTWPDPKRPTYLHTYPATYLPMCTSIREHIDNFGDLWHVRYWLQLDNEKPTILTISTMVHLKLIIFCSTLTPPPPHSALQVAWLKKDLCQHRSKKFQSDSRIHVAL